MASEFWNRFCSSSEKKLKNSTFIILGLLMFIFIITQIVKVAMSAANPMFAFSYVQDANPQEIFPQIGICPSYNQSTTGQISSVACNFYQQGKLVSSVSSGAIQFIVDSNALNCYVANQNMVITATNVTDFIECEISKFVAPQNQIF